MVLIDPPTRWLLLASYSAEKSEHGVYKMGAIVVRGSNIIASGWNKNKTHPRAKNYTRKIHAELDALIDGFRTHVLWGSDMYVVRITNGGAMATSKPCKDCVVLAQTSGIKSITFISEKGEIKCMKL